MILKASGDTIGSLSALCQYLRITEIQKDHVRLLARQIAAARTLLGMSQAELAVAARISVPTLKRMEGSPNKALGMPNNVAAVQTALEAAGVEFIPENGGGAGVRLRKGAAPENHPKRD